MAWVAVHHAGLLTTVQDLGRWGWQSYGVPVSGAMDVVSHRIANALVSNSAAAATLEVTVQGPDLEFDDERLVAVCGGEFALSLDGMDIPEAAPVRVSKGMRLRIGERKRGSRTYVAISGGIDVPQVLGSRATHVPTRTGGLSGRTIRTGDRLPLGPWNSRTKAGRRPLRDWRDLVRLPGHEMKVRVLETPESHRFAAGALAVLTSSSYAISGDSDRMGYRLAGPPVQTVTGGTLLPEATVHGAIQVPPDGIPIVLEADRQTTGGYPKLAIVIAADLGLLGQFAPGDAITFSTCRREEALAALLWMERRLMAIETLNDR